MKRLAHFTSLQQIQLDHAKGAGGIKIEEEQERTNGSGNRILTSKKSKNEISCNNTNTK